MAVVTIERVLGELREELARVNHLILLLEGMAEGRRRRGRPPKFPASSRDGRSSAKGRKRRG